jgi:hypothetical protein
MMRPAAFVLAAALLASGAAMARNYTPQEARAMIDKIPAQAPAMLPDIIRRYGLTVQLVTAGDADASDLKNGFRRGDVVVSVWFSDAGFEALPCGFKTRTAGRLAEFIKRGSAFVPDSELAQWVRTGQCPAP